MENWEQLLASFNDDNDLEGSQDKLDALEKKLFHIDSITGQEELDYTKSTVHDFIPLTTPPIMITEADLEPSLPLDSALDSHVSQYDLKSELELMGEMIQEADFAQSRIQDALTIDPFLEKILLDATASLEPLEVASEILNDIIEHIPYENEISLQIQDEFREIIKRSQDHLNQDITIKDASKTQDDVIYDDDINSPITFKIDSISDVEHEDKVTIDPQTPEITLENIQESSIDLSCSVMSIPSPKKQGKKLKPAKFISHRRSASSYKKSEVSSPLPAVEVIPEQLIDISIQWEEYNSKLAELKQTEKTRENELNETLAKIKKERDAYEKCKFRLEELRSMHTAHTAELRSLKNKFRQQQERNKLAIHWFKVDAKGIFDREKEKSASLIKRTMAIIEANNTLIAKNNEKFKNSIEKSASIKSMIKTISETTSADLKTSHKQMKSESESLRNDLLLQTAEVERKRRLRSNYQAEKTMEVERVRVFDYNLLVGAFKLIYNEETVDLGKLQLVKITNLNLTELPDLNKVPNIRMLDINDNKIVNLDKLKNVNNLNYLKIDSNQVNKLDFLSMRNIKRVDAANNNVSTVSGLSNSRNLKWLDLSNNPFRNLDFLKDSNCIRVLILKNVRVPNLSVLSYLKHTIVLNLSENSLYNDPLICLQNMIILKSLSLSDNMYTEFPDISNTLLFELNLERNKFTSLSFPHLLPSLKILRLEGNRIEKMSNFSMCPNLSELYLFGNNITDFQFLYSLSTCRILKKLDLRKNPITDHDHFIIAINGLFPKLKILNHFNLAEYISSNVKQDASFNSTKEAIIMECIRYLEGTIKDRDLFQETILDDSKETIAIVKSHYQKLKTYLGKYEPPFTAYISSRDDTSTEETMDIQDKNIAWLETALLAQLAQMTKFLKQISPTCDYFVLSKLDSLRKTSELMKITRIQALWRKRQLLGKYQYIRSSVIKIQKTWRNYKWKKAQLNALKVRKQKLLSAVIVFQKYFRGRKARKEARLLKIQNKYYKKKPKKHIIAAHKAEPITYVEQEIVKPTTAIPDIDLIVEDTDLDKWINNTQTETFNAELDSYLENDLVSKEVAKQPTQEPKANKKVRIEELKQHTETKPEDILFEPRKETPPSKVHHNALPKTTFVEEFSLNEFYQKVAENMERTKDSKKPNTNILSQTLLDSRASTPKSSRSLKSRVQTPETRATSRSEVALITDPGFDSKSHSRASSKSELIPNEWNLTSKQSIESLSRKNERFSALARKSAQKEILKDPEERLKQFQRVKNHVVYEWDTPASITVKKPFEKLPPIETNDELRHYNYPTPKVQPGVVLLMNNYVAGKFIKEYEKPIGVPKFQLLKFPKL